MIHVHRSLMVRFKRYEKHWVCHIATPRSCLTRRTEALYASNADRESRLSRRSQENSGCVWWDEYVAWIRTTIEGGVEYVALRKREYAGGQSKKECCVDRWFDVCIDCPRLKILPSLGPNTMKERRI